MFQFDIENDESITLSEIHMLSFQLALSPTRSDSNSPVKIAYATYDQIGCIQSQSTSRLFYYTKIIYYKSYKTKFIFYDTEGKAIGLFDIEHIKYLSKRIKAEFSDNKELRHRARHIAFGFRGTFEEVLSKISTKEGLEDIISYTKKEIENKKQ